MPSALAACCFRTPAQASAYPSGRFPGRERQATVARLFIKAASYRRGPGARARERGQRSTWDCRHRTRVTARWPIRASRSSAPCRMNAAACWSITAARFCAADVGGDQVALDRGGGQPLVPERDRKLGQAREVAREGAGRLRARPLAAVHVDRQAEHEATALRSAASASRRCASAVKVLRAMVSTPVASRRSGSLVATPMVLVPRSSPINAPRGGSSGGNLGERQDRLRA